MTTIEQRKRGRLAHLLPPPPAPDSAADAKAGIRRTRVATWAFLALAVGTAALEWYAVYGVSLLGVVLANGRNDWYRGWIKGYEARRREHLRQVNG
ncbi:hypothetical protein [Micromonospora sp. NPDC047730]|uniref:hypothetical protein n=1 Tax=Micromonospora sp. NPDC047730 TaxID=3364253 RepID=UPI003715CAB1